MKYTGIEECWFIYGIRIKQYYFGFLRYHSKGGPASVEFDWLKALNRFLLGWYHSHPKGATTYPSDRDYRTMRSWVLGKGKSMLCGIFCEGQQQCHLFKKTGVDKQKNSIIERSLMVSKIKGPFFFGVNR